MNMEHTIILYTPETDAEVLIVEPVFNIFPTTVQKNYYPRRNDVNKNSIFDHNSLLMLLPPKHFCTTLIGATLRLN